MSSLLETFTAEQRAELEAGYPLLHRLTDEDLTPAKAAASARKHLNALDPVWGVAVPSAAAHRYLHAYVVARSAKQDRKAALKRSDPFQSGRIDEVMATFSVDLRETYRFVGQSALWCMEALYGTELVAQAAVARLLEIDLEHHGAAPHSYDNESMGHFRLAQTLCTLRPRCRATFGEIVAPLAEARGNADPSVDPFAALLRGIAGGGEIGEDGWGDHLDVATGLELMSSLARLASRWKGLSYGPRFFFLLGPDLWEQAQVEGAPRLPKWRQLRLIDDFGGFRHPATVRLMCWALRSRTAAEGALQWLVDHGDLARPVLETLTAHNKLGANASDALAAIDSAVTKVSTGAPKDLDWDTVTREVNALMSGLEATLLAAKGDPEGEREAMEAAYERYCEVRSAGGEVTPGAYFTHAMSDVDWTAPESDIQRWFDIAMEV